MIDKYAGVTLAVGLTAWFAYRAFFTAPGSFGSWAMFAYIGYWRVDLRDESGAKVSPWDYEVRHDYFGNVQSLAEVVRYLRDERGIRVTGEGVEATRLGYLPVKIENDRVHRGRTRLG